MSDYTGLAGEWWPWGNANIPIYPGWDWTSTWHQATCALCGSTYFTYVGHTCRYLSPPQTRLPDYVPAAPVAKPGS